MPIPLLLPLLLGTAFALQQPGTFHGADTVARDGERWLGLRVVGTDAALVETTVRVQAVEDEMVDEAPGELTGRQVSSIDGDTIVVFLRGSGLRAGRVEHALVEPWKDELPLSQPFVMSFRGETFRIENECASEPNDRQSEQWQYECAAMLRGPNGSQRLAQRTGYYESGSDVMTVGDAASQQLLFAGDLDGDGRLDLVYDTSDHYNVSRPTLFLSSQALDGALLGEAAHQVATGC